MLLGEAKGGHEGINNLREGTTKTKQNRPLKNRFCLAYVFGYKLKTWALRRSVYNQSRAH